jgi:hypothetical protein
MGIRHLYWILTGPSFAVHELMHFLPCVVLVFCSLRGGREAATGGVPGRRVSGG